MLKALNEGEHDSSWLRLFNEGDYYNLFLLYYVYVTLFIDNRSMVLTNKVICYF